MKLYILLALSILLLIPDLYAQKPIRGVAIKDIDSYRTGDTIALYGYRNRLGDEQYLVRVNTGDKYVSSKKIRLLDNELDYWQRLWFQNHASYIRENGWQISQRTLLNDDFLEYAIQMEQNGLLFRDDYLEDYLQQLLLIVHPGALMKAQPSRLNILIIHTSGPEAFAFDNGTIVITTGLLAGTRSEKELLSAISKYTAHIVLDHNLMNLNMEIRSRKSADFWTAFATLASAIALEVTNYSYGTNFYVGDLVITGLSAMAMSEAIIESVGAKYTLEQQKEAESFSEDFMKQLSSDNNFSFLPEKEYMINIASALSASAWQEYKQKQFDRSANLLQPIFDMGIPTEEDYLLKAKLTRSLSNSEQSNRQALSLIDRALEMNDFNYVEALAEKGLILLRLGEVEAAEQIFIEYRNAISEIPDIPPSRNQIWANKMIIKCEQLLQKR